MQFPTETIHFDPNTSFLISLEDGREIVFDLKRGIAFERQVRGSFYPLCVQFCEYEPASMDREKSYYEDKNGFLEADPYFDFDFGQRGSLHFTRLHCVNGVPTIPQGKVLMSRSVMKLD